MKNHEKSLTVRFGDCDPAGVIFYPRAFELAHAAVEEFVGAELGHKAWFASPKLAFPVRHAEADFHAPMKSGETFRVTVSVEEIGTTSVTFAVEFAGASAKPACRVRTVHVALDRKSGKATTLPPEIRAKLR